MKWKPVKWWRNQDVFIIGGGSSLRGFPWQRLHHRLTIGCNDAYKLGLDVCKICVFGDLRWYKAHKAFLENWGNPVFTNQPALINNSPPWLYVMGRKENGLAYDALGWGGNTGCVALNLALILGARRVFLLGFDLAVGENNKTNWHDDNLAKPLPDNEVFDRFIRGFAQMKEDLPKMFPEAQVINLNLDSRLNVFEKMDWREVLDGEDNG